MTFAIGDKVILDGEYYDDGVATEHIIVDIIDSFVGELFKIDPVPNTCSIDGLEDWINSDWFTRAE